MKKSDDTLDTLSIIYDYVKKCKGLDRYIVHDKTTWGVCNSNGEFIVPYKYSRINMTNNALFNAYGDYVSTAGLVTTYPIKYLDIYNLQGKLLVKSTTPSIKRVIPKSNTEIYGVLLGYSEYDYLADADIINSNIVYVGADSSVITFEHSIEAITKSILPGVIYLRNNKTEKLEIFDLDQMKIVDNLSHKYSVIKEPKSYKHEYEDESLSISNELRKTFRSLNTAIEYADYHLSVSSILNDISQDMEYSHAYIKDKVESTPLIISAYRGIPIYDLVTLATNNASIRSLKIGRE